MKRRARWLGPLVLAAGCSNLLGLSQPREAIDAPPGGSGDAATPDGPPLDAGPGTLHVVVGGTAGAGMVVSDPSGIACPGTCDATFPPATQVTLTVTGGFGTYTGIHGVTCGSGSGSGSAVIDETCAFTVASGDTTVYARWFGFADIIFVTSTQQAPGSFDSVGAADALCNQLAATSGLPGAYTAWLPASGTSALDRVEDATTGGGAAGFWDRPDGQPFAASPFALDTGEVLFPARLDEYGRDLGEDGTLAVTDTTATGGIGGGESNQCSQWASTSVAGLVLAGEPAGGTGRWDALTGITCDTATARIYCVGNSATPQFASARQLGPTLFASSETMDGSGGTALADAICTTEGRAGQLSGGTNTALITPGNGRTVQSRFNGLFVNAGPVSRPDGVELAPSFEALFGSADLEATPNVGFGSAVGSAAAPSVYFDEDVWVGGAGFADFKTDCTGWTSSSSAQLGGTRPAATSRGSDVFATATCDQQRHVLCLNYEAAESAR